MHKLTEIDPNNRTAICSECGPIKIRRKGENKWRCATKDNERHKRRPKRIRFQPQLCGYEISLDLFKRLLHAQKEVCAICKQKPGYRLSVDHDHLSRKTRGLLCFRCNMNLEWFEQYREEAQDYLDNPPIGAILGE